MQYSGAEQNVPIIEISFLCLGFLPNPLEGRDSLHRLLNVFTYYDVTNPVIYHTNYRVLFIVAVEGAPSALFISKSSSFQVITASCSS